MTEELVAGEVLNQVGESPLRCSISKNGTNPAISTATWIVSFKKEVKPFYLFDATSTARFIKPKIRITHHINGCQGWCNPIKCQRLLRCNNCGRPTSTHEGPTGASCTAHMKCANCLGPHQAGYEKCPAKPRVQGKRVVKPTKRELRLVRSAGLLATRAATQARQNQEQASTDTRTPETRTSSPDTVAGLIPQSSPSPCPPCTQAVILKRGHRVEEYERAGSASRPTRQCKPTSSLNLPELSRISTGRVGKKASKTPQLQSPNLYSSLGEEDDMDVDSNSSRSQ